MTNTASSQTTIYAVVEPICSVEAGSDSVVLDIRSRGQQPVTTLSYVCNEANGITRTVVSENGGSLRRNAQAIPYFVSQSGGSGLALARTQLTTPAISNVGGSATLTAGTSGIFSVDIPSIAPDLLAGDYRDTITVAITPN